MSEKENDEIQLSKIPKILSDWWCRFRWFSHTHYHESKITVSSPLAWYPLDIFKFKKLERERERERVEILDKNVRKGGWWDRTFEDSKDSELLMISISIFFTHTLSWIKNNSFNLLWIPIGYFQIQKVRERERERERVEILDKYVRKGEWWDRTFEDSKDSEWLMISISIIFTHTLSWIEK